MKANRIRALCLLGLLAVASRQGNGQTRDPVEQNEQVVINPHKLDFGPQTVGAPSSPRTVNVRNNSESELRLDYILTSGIDFTQTNTCGRTLAADASCSITVTFRPAIPGSRIGTLILFNSAPHSPQHVDLAGIGEE